MSRTTWTAVGLFVIALVVFRASPRGQLYDSRYTLLVSHQLVTAGDPALDDFVGQLGGVDAAGRPLDYRLVATGGHVHWLYPLGTPLLAAPFVAAADLAGRGPVDAAGHYDRRAERRAQRWLAAGAMAVAGVLFLWTAQAWLALRESAIVAAAALFSSPVWSTASRSLWSQTGALLLVSAAVALLARGRRRGTSIRPVAIASLLAWAWLCRPTAAVPAVALTAFVALRHRDAWWPLVATGAAWGIVFLGAFLAVYDHPLPPYYRLATHTFGWMPEALAGNWLSPGRGLLVYCPVVVVVAGWLVTRWRGLPDRSLAVLALCVIALHWVLVSVHAPWWGGYGYGPRLMTGTVPWLVVLGVLGWAAAPSAPARRGRAAAAVASVLLAAGVVLNGVGAISRSAADWNHHQAEPDFAERLWRWRDAPFLAPLHAARHAPRPAADAAPGAWPIDRVPRG